MKAKKCPNDNCPGFMEIYEDKEHKVWFCSVCGYSEGKSKIKHPKYIR